MSEDIARGYIMKSIRDLKTLSNLTVTVLIVIIPAMASAAFEEDETYSDYSEIVNELQTKDTSREPDYFTDTNLHFGAGYSNSLTRLSGDGIASRVSLQGFQVGFGMDFTQNFLTEVSYTNYTPHKKDGNEYSLQEYALRGIFQSPISQIIIGRLGFGLASRNLEISGRDYRDPASQLFGGLEAKFGNKASVVTELAFKDSFTNDTPERTALDLSVRIDGHF